MDAARGCDCDCGRGYGHHGCGYERDRERVPQKSRPQDYAKCACENPRAARARCADPKTQHSEKHYDHGQALSVYL